MSNRERDQVTVREVGFEEALDTVMPILRDIKKSLRLTPKATRTSLEKLASVKATPKVTAETTPISSSMKKPTAPAPIPTRSAAPWIVPTAAP